MVNSSSQSYMVNNNYDHLFTDSKWLITKACQMRINIHLFADCDSSICIPSDRSCLPFALALVRCDDMAIFLPGMKTLLGHKCMVYELYIICYYLYGISLALVNA